MTPQAGEKGTTLPEINLYTQVRIYLNNNKLKKRFA